ncbi:DsbE family thiol:disulfide interchange protein [Aquabacterium sp.]|uniref:DsbE family thiol:disulfide interchange protein n=1 Tax=Aquabacterium sp. TaxID=1872578 RepID=UPI003D6D4020
MKRYLLPLFIFLGLATALGLGLGRDPTEIPSPLVGKPAPPFSLAQLDDPRKPFGPQHMKGQVWLLNVWASWCVSCREEHPVLLGLSKEGVAPIVGLDYQDELVNGQQWLTRHGNPYQLTVSDRDGRVSMDLGVYGVPETFVIDKQGRIRLRHAGPITPEVLKNKLLPLIEELKRG